MTFNKNIAAGPCNKSRSKQGGNKRQKNQDKSESLLGDLQINIENSFYSINFSHFCQLQNKIIMGKTALTFLLSATTTV